MKLKLPKKLCMGIFGIVVAVVMWILAKSQITATYGLESKYSVGPDFFPKLVIILMFVSGIVLVIQSIFKFDEETVVIDLKKELIVLIYFAVLMLYVFLLKKIGFIFDTIFASCALLALQKCKKWWYYAVAVAMVLIVYFGFVYGFKIRLPLGWPLKLL